MRSLARTLGVAGLCTLLSCAGSNRATRGPELAANCEVSHRLAGNDTIDARVERIEGGWLVSLRMRVHMSDDGSTPPIEVHGLGRVSRADNGLSCLVVDAGAPPGTPRFDEALCLDELESLADLIEDAEQSARPGETVVQEVSLRARRRRRSRRSAVAARVRPLRERAEITRDAQGRLVALTRTSEQNDREEIRVAYPAGASGHCVRLD